MIFKMAAHTEVAISAATWEAVHQQGNQELHGKQEEAMILAVPSIYVSGRSLIQECTYWLPFGLFQVQIDRHSKSQAVGLSQYLKLNLKLSSLSVTFF